MQKCLLDQIGKVGVEFKIPNGQKVSLHKSDFETSHDISKFWLEFLLNLSNGGSSKRAPKLMKVILRNNAQEDIIH